VRHAAFRRPLLALLLAVPLLLAGCADYGRAEREARMAAFVGVSETDLIRQLGVPTRTVDSGGHRFLAYVKSQVELVPATPFYGFGPGGFYPWGYGGGFPAHAVEWRCETTFELVDGKVFAWSQRGNYC